MSDAVSYGPIAKKFCVLLVAGLFHLLGWALAAAALTANLWAPSLEWSGRDVATPLAFSAFMLVLMTAVGFVFAMLAPAKDYGC